ncbi:MULTISPECIES: YihY/virulence factor BrkB family protein [Halolamina]|uniref:YihY family inner membrane protein n=1 Tax=Halolamina pelagica TaxID=699431 RepID=A0A1I5SDA3_9EURY|nr:MULTISPECIES: YihY/virulence factor BrkB family protein [Halolamina]NHX37112.1 YihY/virulence factor BrkB family protein [Halolamina sp. R1-12]SFP68705.1 YihY family inner membrane protein [Halolamina pelagica]
MLSRLRSALGTGKRVGVVAKEQELTFLAAAVAYYAFVSLIPAAVLALIVATTVGGEQLATVLLESTSQFLTPSGQEVLTTALTASEGRGSATLLGLAFLLWGTLKVFRALDTAFSEIYGVEHGGTALDQVIDSLVVVVGIGTSMTLMFALAGAFAAFSLGIVVEALGVLTLPILLTAAFLPLFYRFPDTAVTVREVLPGALVAAVVWTAMQAGFQLYASVASTSAYGIVGGVILLVTWLYLAGAAVMLGAVVNVVLAEDRVAGPDEAAGGRAGSPPDAGAHRAAASHDRQFQGHREPASEYMAEREPRGAPDVADLAEEVEELRSELDGFEEDVEQRTVDRPQLEADLKAYVRARMRQGKATGWGPYLVLLYGTVMSLGAFYWLQGWPAVAAMLVTFTSTLGLYVLFVLFGGVIGAVRTAGGVAERLR